MKKTISEKQKILVAARKAQTHLSRVIDMLQNGDYCIDVLQQALAVQGLLKGVIRRIFGEHMRTCFTEALCHGSKRKQEEVIKEITRVMELAERS